MKLKFRLIFGLFMSISVIVSSQNLQSTNPTTWFKEAGFGMFIHWGLYSIPAGMWKGEPIEDNRYINPYAEHIMMLEKIPISEYSRLADRFNPVDFNAVQIVDLAKKAGMRYLVFTTKHHDGFAMYDSKVSDFNIVKATPYKKDPLKAISEACKKEGIKLCLYYSLGRDWEDPNAVARDSRRNTWDFPDTTGLSYQKYLNDKVKPQITELLTNYGEVGLFWFDTPELTTREQSIELELLIKSLQPNCIINTRVGNKVGDIDEMSDNQIAETAQTKPWESPATMAESWGYSILDTKEYWKSSDEMIEKLVEIRSKGGNYLLNIGPDAKGSVPTFAVDRLNDIARWMEVNSEAIYKTSPVKKLKLHNGRFTQSGDNLYVHVSEHPYNETILLYIDPNSVKGIKLLTKSGEIMLDYKATQGKGIMISLPKVLPFPSVSVIKIETNIKPQ